MQNLSSIKDKVELALQLRGHVVECMLDRSGNHLIQKCFTHIPTAEDGHSIEFMLKVRPCFLSGAPRLLSEGRPNHCNSCQDQKAGMAQMTSSILGVVVEVSVLSMVSEAQMAHCREEQLLKTHL
jgi:hypothetical protein